MLTKRGEPQKVDETFISRVNEFGISPLMNERRLNLRTMSARTRARLENKVDEQHGWALKQSNEETFDLKAKLEDETYEHLLEREAVRLRARNQKKKDQKALTQAVEKQDKLLERIAAVELSSKGMERQIRVETIETEKAEARCEALEALQSCKRDLEAKCGELEAAHGKCNEAGKELKKLRQKAKVQDGKVNEMVATLDSWKANNNERRKRVQKDTDTLRQERDNLFMVVTLPPILFIISFVFPLSYFCVFFICR